MRAFEVKSAWNLAMQDAIFDYDADEEENNPIESGAGESGETDNDVAVRNQG